MSLKQISVCLSTEQLHRLYDRLEEAETPPYALRVRTAERGRSLATIFCGAEDAAYFQSMLTNEI